MITPAFNSLLSITSAISFRMDIPATPHQQQLLPIEEPHRGRHGVLFTLISLNLRWLPTIVSVRQALGLEPVRIMGHQFVAGRYAVKRKPEATGHPTEFDVTTGSPTLPVQPGEAGALGAVEIEAVR